MSVSVLVPTTGPWSAVAGHAALADELGYDSINCSHIRARDSFTTLAALASMANLAAYFHFQLHWVALELALIVLGSGVGLKPDARLTVRRRNRRRREDWHHSWNGQHHPVVTAAGLVFAFTMGSMITVTRSIGQFGTTIGIGLSFDTLVVRSLITPSIATLLGRWSWWPRKVRIRPASQMLRLSDPGRWSCAADGSAPCD